MNFQEIKRLDEKYYAETFSRFPVAFVGGKGATLVDTEGKEYVDFGAGIAVNIFGVNDEEWKQAVITQLNGVQHLSNLYYCESQAKLAELLCKKTGAKRVFFGNSGAEANECAMKAARKYSYDKYGEGRYKIIALNNSFHGRTLFTLSATGQDIFHQYYMPFVAGVECVDANMKSVTDAAADGTACAVMIECVQGESGVTVLDAEFLQMLGKFCSERDILLIVDEVQTGYGRTGKMFSYEHFGISPDIVTVAKGIAGGLPLGACLFYKKTERVFSAGDHGSTFGGNPVCCAAGVNVIERLTDEFMLEVQGKAEYLRAKLRIIDGVNAVTGLGMMIGLDIDKNVKEVAAACLKKGLLVLTAHKRLRLLPPLTITKTEMDEGLTILREVLNA